MKGIFEGIFTALITPFSGCGLDYNGFSDFVEWQIQEGINGLVLCGTTGEAHLLSDAEYVKLINFLVEINRSRVPIIVGVPSNSTARITSIIDKVKSSSISAFLVATPYYINPTQDGIFKHYKAICDNTDFPIVIYNVPHRCGIAIDDATMLKLINLKRIIAIKDATADLKKPLIYRKASNTISLLSGDDATYFNFKINGGDGCISVVSNTTPGFCVRLHNAIDEDIKKACRMNEILFPLAQALFCETNPIAVKYAVSILKEYIAADTRLPLTPATDETRVIIRSALLEFERDALEFMG